jgi:Cu+-exporting ATPase
MKDIHRRPTRQGGRTRADSAPPGVEQAVAVFTIEGMMCAACVGTVEGALTTLVGVQKAGVALLTERAEVTFDPAVITEDAIAEHVEAVGFGATHCGTTKKAVSRPAVPVPSQSVTRVAIEGMMCAACAGTVEGALKDLTGVLQAQVVLLTERAEVKYDPKVCDVADIVGMIEAVGFDAEHIETEAIQKIEGACSERAQRFAF